MEWNFSPVGTLALAAFVLIIGRHIQDKVSWLKKYSIPVPVIGGLLAAILIALMNFANLHIKLNTGMQPGLLLAFFATVGLSADLGSIRKAGGALPKFFACVVAVLILQNLLGIAYMLLIGQDPLYGLLTGSIAMSGGHGTGVAWAAKFTESYGLKGTLEIALASATFGLVAGGLIGGPVGRFLAEKVRKDGGAMDDTPEGPATETPPDRVDRSFTPERLISSIFLIAFSIAVGMRLSAWLDNPTFTVPTFVWALVAGLILRNLVTTFGIAELDSEAINFAGSVALALFLAMAMISLNLADLASLAGPLLPILLLQALLVSVFVIFVTFRFMGRDYDSALLAAGQVGFGLGATPTAIVNMESVAARFGWSRRAFLIIPIVGAFMIDIANAFVLSGFMRILTQGR